MCERKKLQILMLLQDFKKQNKVLLVLALRLQIIALQFV